ncbi:MAG TPA: cytochrome c oxidase assembly protein [Gemmatimonadales bacterium]|nr:cytochrome c oxidase assembly protein [Gemmatimonadales bacterium]
MTWWCSATGEPWTWAWKAYPGVWLFVGLLAVLYWAAVWRPVGAQVHTRLQGRHTAWFAAGLFAIWLALDWPIGALGAGYLTSFHTITYILLVMVAAPSLILSIPEQQLSRWCRTGTMAKPLWLLARPWLALSLFNVIVLGTHMPAIVDGLMVTQIGAFAVDLAWLLAGFALWWPVMGPPDVVRMKRPMKMAYLFASTLLPIIPSAFLTFADYPIYATYELAPRIFPLLTARSDQQVAGLLMKIVGDLPIWFGFAVIFFRWSKESEQVRRAPVHPSAQG